MGSLFSHFPAHRSVPSDVFDTNYGKIRGKKFDISDGAGRFVNAFLGIPYAKPPTGALRFKMAQPPKKWSGVRECTMHGPRAPQVDMLFERLSNSVPKSEDCLYLNVFAPDWEMPPDQENGRATLVWIHGGAFVIHSSANYGDYGICKYLCAKEVVVVTLQYRLGLFGFSATGDENCVSNLGLRDQTSALRWVKENISSFGGDPDNITVFGQSAGGVCADILALSPYSRDLFNKVIPMSGNASCSWAIRDTVHVRNTIRAHAEVLGWVEPEGNEIEKNASLMDFLRHQPVSALEVSFDGKPGFRTNSEELDIVPVVDGDFIPEPIEELRRKVPRKVWMIGVTEYEALLFAPLKKIRPYSESLERLLNEKISDCNYFDAPKLRNQAREIYVGSNTSQEGIVRSLMRVRFTLITVLYLLIRTLSNDVFHFFLDLIILP
uniref:Carboxylic ester hydrolase n=1 Tax=Ascaris lumbricoides TaxID=6252 RepID=A0A0M3IDX1_ASCLU